MRSCVLLGGGRGEFFEVADLWLREHFEVKWSELYARSVRELSEEAKEILRGGSEYIFNFLSPIILSGDQLKKANTQAINFHPAPPAYPGVGSASYALFNGDIMFGVTAHEMEEKVDSGKILKVMEFSIREDDTCETLNRRAQMWCLSLLMDVTGKIAMGYDTQEGNYKWSRSAYTRKEFEKWMDVTKDDYATMKKKLKALKHSKFSGPYFVFNDERFEVPAG